MCVCVCRYVDVYVIQQFSRNNGWRKEIRMET